MADLTTDAQLSSYNEGFQAYPVAASTTIYKGSIVGLNSSGYARAFEDGDIFVGHAQARVVNTTAADGNVGSNGDLNVECYADGYSLETAVTGVALTDVGAPVFATTDNNDDVSLTPGASRVGYVEKYLGTNSAIVRFEPVTAKGAGRCVVSFVREFDCEDGEDGDAVTLIPAHLNPNGLLILNVVGRVTEQFGGGTEDQGVITIKDTKSSPTTLTTLTASDSGADAVGDIVVGYVIGGATTGDAGEFIDAGYGVTAQVTQATSGASAAGKIQVLVYAVAL